jgi:hypothetical protein
MSITEVLHDLQQNLKAPKDKNNSFGNYKYRSAEGILEAVKPLLPKGVTLTLSDDVVNIGDHNYIKAVALLKTSDDSLSVSSLAREAMSKKGMDCAQITGSASSYARKYALNGMFAIDDSKDADTDEFKNEVENTPEVFMPTPADENKVKDIRFLIRDCDNSVDLNSVMDELSPAIESLHEDLQSDIYEAQDEVMGLIESDKYVVDNKYSYSNVDHGKLFLDRAEKFIDSCEDKKKLEDWFTRWMGKLRALDTILSAKAYQTEEGSPYMRVQIRYNKRIEELN